MRTLVLNAGYEPLQLITWQRALCLILSDKAEIVSEYEVQVRSVSVTYLMPSVVRLKKYARVVSRFGIVRCTRKNVFLRDNYQCQYCGVKCRPGHITIDHVLARSKGGKTTWTNVVAACHPCNRRKGSKDLSEIDMKPMKMPRRPSIHELYEENHGILAPEWLPFLKAVS